MWLHSYSLLIAFGLCSFIDCSSSSRCDRPQPVKSAWYSKHMDEYLQNFPGNRVLTFQDGDLRQLGIHDDLSFHPGRKSNLTTNQSCNPSVNDSDWLVLKSVENWIDYVNSLSSNIDQIGSGLLDDVVAKLSSFLSRTRNPAIHIGRLQKRMIPTAGEAPQISNYVAKTNVELHPSEIPKNLEVPLANRLIPEPHDHSAKLPPVWVRASRYVHELMRRGARRFQKLLGKSSTIPYFESRLKPVLTEEAKQIEAIQLQKIRVLKWWVPDYSESQDAQINPDRKEELKGQLFNWREEWEEYHQQEAKVVNEHLRKKSEEQVDEYNNAVIDLQKAQYDLDNLSPPRVDPDPVPLQPTNTAPAKSAPEQSANGSKGDKNLAKKQREEQKSAEAKAKKERKEQEDREKKNEKHREHLRKDAKQRILVAENKLRAMQFEQPTYATHPLDSVSEQRKHIKGPRGRIHAPPPPEIFQPKELFSLRSANIAYQKNLVRDRWERLYRAAIKTKPEQTPDAKQPPNAQQTQENIKQMYSQLEATVTEWDGLHRQYLIARRVESLQQAIDKGASKVELSKKSILRKLRPIHGDHKHAVEEILRLKQEHGHLVDQVVVHTGSWYLQSILKSLRDESAPKKRPTFHKRDLNSDSTKLNVDHDQRSSMLDKIRKLTTNNMNQVLKISSLKDGIFSIIRQAQFISPVDSHLIAQDLKMLIELILISSLLEKLDTSIVINLSKTCEPKSFKPTKTEGAATFCSSDGLIYTMLIGKNEGREKFDVFSSLQELDQFVNSNGYQLSDIVNLALECNNSQDQYVNNHLISTPESHSLSRLNGISVCTIDLPVTYLMD